MGIRRSESLHRPGTATRTSVHDDQAVVWSCAPDTCLALAMARRDAVNVAPDPCLALEMARGHVGVSGQGREQFSGGWSKVSCKLTSALANMQG